MTEENDLSSDEGGESTIAVRQVQTTDGLTSSAIEAAVRTALGDTPCRAISVAVVDDATIAQLHERYRNESGPTDVLTFDLRDDLDDAAIEGEIVVSAETAERQAADHETTPAEEIIRYTIHGVLHLCGLDDQTAAQRDEMRRAEDQIMASVTGGSSAGARSGGNRRSGPGG